MVQAVAVRNVQIAKGTVGNNRIDVFAFQFKLPETQYKGRIYNNRTKNNAIGFRWCDKVPDRLIDKDDISLGH